MSIDIYMQRARLLMQQHRPAQAMESLRQVLAEDPQSAEAHALLALCLLENRDQWREATREVEQAIHLAPDAAYVHYVHALVLDKRNHLVEALQAIDEALRIDPEDADYYGVKASLLTQQQRWADALEAAETGLQYDPDHGSCGSLRTFSLERMGRSTDALREADRAVARDPDSATAHCSRGWALLNTGKYQLAQEAFREALRLQPTNEFARSGMIQSLNSNHFLFRWMFKFYSSLGRLSEKMQWGVILGLFIGTRVLRALANANPQFEPYVMPILILYMCFCLLSWISDPLFNTFLRFHPFGKFLLSDKQRWASNLIASLLLIGIVSAALIAVFGHYPEAILLLIMPISLTIPVSTVFETDDGWPQRTAIALATAFAVLYFLTAIMIFADGPWGFPLAGFVGGIFLFSFFGSWLKNATVKH